MVEFLSVGQTRRAANAAGLSPTSQLTCFADYFEIPAAFAAVTGDEVKLLTIPKGYAVVCGAVDWEILGTGTVTMDVGFSNATSGDGQALLAGVSGAAADTRLFATTDGVQFSATADTNIFLNFDTLTTPAFVAGRILRIWCVCVKVLG